MTLSDFIEIEEYDNPPRCERCGSWSKTLLKLGGQSLCSLCYRKETRR